MNAARRTAHVILGLVLLSLSVAAGVPQAQTQGPEPASIKPAASAGGIERPAAARPVRERMAVYVILGWVWFVVGVLLYLLRLRVREADRVHRMGFEGGGAGPKGQGH